MGRSKAELVLGVKGIIQNKYIPFKKVIFSLLTKSSLKDIWRNLLVGDSALMILHSAKDGTVS